MFKILFLICFSSIFCKAANLVPTIYCTPEFSEADDCESKKYKSLMDASGKPILKLCEKDFDMCELQGSCIYTTATGERKLYNFIDEVTNKVKKRRLLRAKK